MIYLTPEHALSEIDRMRDRVGPRGRWPIWVWLAGGLGSAVFDTFAPPITHGLLGHIVAFGFAALALAVVWFALAQRVVGRTPPRLELRVTVAFVGLMLVDVAYRLAASPTHLDAAVAVLGCLPAVPMLYGAWRVWRQ